MDIPQGGWGEAIVVLWGVICFSGVELIRVVAAVRCSRRTGDTYLRCAIDGWQDERVLGGRARDRFRAGIVLAMVAWVCVTVWIGSHQT